MKFIIGLFSVTKPLAFPGRWVPGRTLTLLICLIATASVASSQEPSKAAIPESQANPLSTHTKMMYRGMTENILLRSAEKMPEANYNFKPTDAVRSYGQILGHVADSQYSFCSIVLGEKNPTPNIEKTKTSKADLIAALKGAFAYCDKAYGGMTDATGSQLVMVKAFGGDMPKLSVLAVNLLHSALHYGNLITYMRLKNIIPPSSEPGFMTPPKK